MAKPKNIFITEREALIAFINTIESTGGVRRHRFGGRSFVVPVADDEWGDLGEAYVMACKAIGRPRLFEKVV